jgi:hypothetical protein
MPSILLLNLTPFKIVSELFAQIRMWIKIPGLFRDSVWKTPSASTKFARTRTLAARTFSLNQVRVLQPTDHGNRQGHGDNIEGFATHKMVILQIG